MAAVQTVEPAMIRRIDEPYEKTSVRITNTKMKLENNNNVHIPFQCEAIIFELKGLLMVMRIAL